MLIYLDWIRLIFLFLVLFISSQIILYCCDYIYGDYIIERFFYLIILFILSILFIIIRPNLIRLILGWDGLGLISYCLIIYYQNYYRYNCGILTVLINRVGDVIIILRIGLIIRLGRWNFMNYIQLNNLVIILIIICAFTKSAQYPFSLWLPAAIAAPTPVSSLVHSSTLVTAGIYLLIRFNEIFNYNFLLNLILYIGIFTMNIAGVSACNEFDLKKIIAYSTLSQLGIIIISYSISYYIVSFFHLVIHAIFKSIIFICSGVLIHNILNYQDLRYIGKLKIKFPVVLRFILISNFSLCAIPFISGFYSKDLILELIFINNNSLFLLLILYMGVILTVLYSFRLIYYLLNNQIKFSCLNMIKDRKLILFSIIILIFMSVILGKIIFIILFLNLEYIYLISIQKLMILLIIILIFIVSLKIKNKLNFLIYIYNKIWFLFLLIKFNLIIINGLKLMKRRDKSWREIFFKDYFIYIYINLNLIIIFMNLKLLNLIFFIIYIILFYYLIF